MCNRFFIWLLVKMSSKRQQAALGKRQSVFLCFCVSALLRCCTFALCILRTHVCIAARLRFHGYCSSARLLHWVSAFLRFCTFASCQVRYHWGGQAAALIRYIRGGHAAALIEKRELTNEVQERKAQQLTMTTPVTQGPQRQGLTMQNFSAMSND